VADRGGSAGYPHARVRARASNGKDMQRRPVLPAASPARSNGHRSCALTTSHDLCRIDVTVGEGPDAQLVDSGVP
jgi:hypothetical protein